MALASHKGEMNMKKWIFGLAFVLAGATLAAQILPTNVGQTILNLVLTQATNQLTLGAAAHTLVISSTAPAGATQTLTLPDPTGADSVAYLALAQTLTNKTLTAPVISTVTNTGTLTLANATGGVPVSLYCGSTGVGNQTCTPTAAANTVKIYSGHSTLSSNAAVITFSPAFASTTYDCIANDITTRANPVQMISTSASTATITNTTGASDVINWHCIGQ